MTLYYFGHFQICFHKGRPYQESLNDIVMHLGNTFYPLEMNILLHKEHLNNVYYTLKFL